MSCPIFRCQSINTLSDLDNSGKHNKREKDHYDSNSDIKIEESKNNIEIVKCNMKYDDNWMMLKIYIKLNLMKHDLNIILNKKEMIER